MQFVAFERAKQGTGASRRLRNSGKTPGIVYGGAAEPQLIEIDHNALWHALKKEAFHSSILDMELAGKVQKVLLRDVLALPQGHGLQPAMGHLGGDREANRVLVEPAGLPGRGREVQVAASALTTFFQRALSAVITSLRAAPLAQAAGGQGPVLFLSGPEGGLAAAEEDLALAHSFAPVTLGPRVLRAETAPLAALAALTLL